MKYEQENELFMVLFSREKLYFIRQKKKQRSKCVFECFVMTSQQAFRFYVLIYTTSNYIARKKDNETKINNSPSAC